ncbi:hypothetical protein [Edaphobacter aggregans]|uniref:hypothetical protein n=1 Tax=Edaphobacter aggregans TaxID=570835 RepID=UPI0012FC0005|nr:hypothetical protein [Edaphobacter aggregans]
MPQTRLRGNFRVSTLRSLFRLRVLVQARFKSFEFNPDPSNYGYNSKLTTDDVPFSAQTPRR